MKDLNKSVSSVIVSMDQFFKKAPALPVGVKDFLVKVAPYAAVIFGILGVLGGLNNLFMQSAVLNAIVGNSIAFKISTVLGIVASALMVFAYPKLKEHKNEGWMLLFWVEVVNLASVLVLGQVVSVVIGALIGFYIIFQIKSYYK